MARSPSKGGRGSPSVESPPQFSVSEVEPHAPECYACGEAAAVTLFIDGDELPGSYFCGPACAARFAVEHLHNSRHAFCQVCLEWSNDGGLCNCDREEILDNLDPELWPNLAKAVNP